METEKKKCMLCGKAAPLIKGGICDSCQERIRREALGQQSEVRNQAEKELKKYGIVPDSGKERK